MTSDPLEREKMFQRWWKASKYCQVIYPKPHLEQYARDGFAAGISAALKSAPPHMGGVRVKPLGWHEHVKGVHRAETIVGDYRVWTHHEADGLVFWRLSDGGAKAEGQGTEAECYAAAQADYERRILSALASHEPAPRDNQTELSATGESGGSETIGWTWTWGPEGKREFSVDRPDERSFPGKFHNVTPLVRQSALTACQQEVERLTRERDEAQNRYSSAVIGEIETTQRAEAAEARNTELVKALEPFAKIAGLFEHLEDDGGSVMVNVGLGALRSARAALGGQSNG